jgi:flavin-dependent dehydrogenase
MYDVIIVGARVAGSSLARLLAKRGARILLVDRARFPSDTLNGHYIQAAGTRYLARWGLLDRVLADAAAPVRRHRLQFGAVELEGTLAWPGGEPALGLAPRRHRLDALLLAAAAEEGVEVREACPVLELVREGDRVVGIRARSGEEYATVVVGADGFRSTVASEVGAPMYADLPSRGCGYYSHWAGLPTDALEFFLLPGRFALAFPTDDGLTCVYVGWTADYFPTVRANVEREFLTALELWPELADRTHMAKRVEPFRGTADLPMFLRQPWGPGWALVGDAGCRVDPITGQGITDAFRDAELLAGALSSEGGNLADYQHQRDAAVLPLYRFTAERARLAPPAPDMQQLLGALRGNQEQTNRFIGITAGSTQIADFFSPDNVAQILSAAPARAA